MIMLVIYLLISVWSDTMISGRQTIDYFQDFEESRKNLTSCQDPPPVSNTYRWMVGTNVMYECVDGYENRDGPRFTRLECENIHQWRGTTPKCELNCGAVTQMPLADVVNITNEAKTIVTAIGDLNYGEVHYSCHNGTTHYPNESYALVETCDTRYGKWTGPRSLCIYKSALPLTLLTISLSLFNEPDDVTLNSSRGNRFNNCSRILLLEDETLSMTYDINTENITEVTMATLVLSSPFDGEGCYKELTLYNPLGHNISTLNVAENGLPCLYWVDVFNDLGTSLQAEDYNFPDANVTDVQNFCRNPTVNRKTQKKPWCYTQGNKVGLCDVPQCPYLHVQVSLVGSKTLGKPKKIYTIRDAKKYTFHTSNVASQPYGTQIKVDIKSVGAERYVTPCHFEIHGRLYEENPKEPLKGRGYVYTGLDNDTDEWNYKCAEGFHALGDDSSLGAEPWTSKFCTDERLLAVNIAMPEMDNNESTCIFLDSHPASSILPVQDFVQHSLTLEEGPMEVSHVLVVQDVPGTPQHGPCVEVELIYDNLARPCDAIQCAGNGRVLFTCLGIPLANTIRMTFYSPNATLCEVKAFGRRFYGALECSRKLYGEDYKGRVNKTMSGRDCWPWEDVDKTLFNASLYIFPDEDAERAQNLCRNPIKNGAFLVRKGQGPACYVKHGNQFRLELCGIPYCNYICRQTPSGTDYIGKIKHTHDSKACTSWHTSVMKNDYFLRASDFSGKDAEKSKYCRNPGHSQDRPWCFLQTHNSHIYYDYCNVPLCPVTSSVDTVVLDLFEPSDESALRNISATLKVCYIHHKRLTPRGNLYTEATTFCRGKPSWTRLYLCLYREPENVTSYGDDAQWIQLAVTCARVITTTPTTTTTTTATTTATTPTTTATTPTTTATTLTTTATAPTTTATTPTTTAATGDGTDIITKSIDSMLRSEITGLCPQHCNVPCFKKFSSPEELNLAINLAIDKIHKELHVDKNDLSSTKRKKTSAPDSRPTSTSVGYLAVILLLIPFILITAADAARVYAYFYPITASPLD